VASPEQRPITDAVLARLVSVVGLVQGSTLFDAEAPEPPPTAVDTGRTVPYVIAYPFGGTPGPDPNVGDTITDLTYTIQLTCVAGFRADLEHLVFVVDGALNRWVPVVSGLTFGAFRPPPGYSPGPIQRDQSVLPPRFWLPLQYRTPATT
jgi:hypothetical protein